jgi:uncharacterized protein (DUF952 family)
MSLIYHITTRSAAQTAREIGEYRAESLASQGFIHLSQLHQVLGVANAFYADQKDLVILVVDPARLKSELKYEAPVHPGAASASEADSEPLREAPAPIDQRFPHLYGPLNFDAVIKIVDLSLADDGSFKLPALI